MDAANRAAKRRGTNTPVARLLEELIQGQRVGRQINLFQVRPLSTLALDSNRCRLKPIRASPSPPTGWVWSGYADLTEEDLDFQEGESEDFIKSPLSNTRVLQ